MLRRWVEFSPLHSWNFRLFLLILMFILLSTLSESDTLVNDLMVVVWQYRCIIIYSGWTVSLFDGNPLLQVLMLMKNLCVNLVSPEFEDHVSVTFSISVSYLTVSLG